MMLSDVRLSITENYNEKSTRYLTEVFQTLHDSGFNYLSYNIVDVDEDTPDDEVIEVHSAHIEELMNEDDYTNIEVVSLKNYSRNTLPYVYKPWRDRFETRLITHGQCSIFVKVNGHVYEFQCRQGDMIRLPADLCYWIEVGVHGCRYIHLFMTEHGWDKPSDKQDIQACRFSGPRLAG